MQKKSNLDLFNFDINVRCASNGLVVEYQDIINEGVSGMPIHSLHKTVVLTSKQDLLDLISDQLDRIYK